MPIGRCGSVVRRKTGCFAVDVSKSGVFEIEARVDNPNFDALCAYRQLVPPLNERVGETSFRIAGGAWDRLVLVRNLQVFVHRGSVKPVNFVQLEPDPWDLIAQQSLGSYGADIGRQGQTDDRSAV